jgi:osmotically-inducible protein OsmY
VHVPIGVKVTARNGALILEGEVEWLFEKEAAADAVAHLDGVKGVSNQIVVKPRVGIAEVKADIGAAIHRCADIDARHVLVSVDGSIVTLSGEVSSWHQRQEAERAAGSAPGITRVENLIVVAPSVVKGEDPWSLR